MAVLDAQQLGAHLLEAAGFLPQLGRLHHGHGFDGAGAVHFLAHDGLDLADHAQAHGHVVVDASTQLFDHAGPHHQLVADHFGVGRSFFQGGDEKLGGFHGTGNSVEIGMAACRSQGAMHNEHNSKIWGLIMLDRDGFRPNVGIILLNQRNQVFWGKRIRTHSWQFPQGGIDRGERPSRPCSASCTRKWG
jgi:hypothetical protein